jgi:hypothetical protein
VSTALLNPKTRTAPPLPNPGSLVPESGRKPPASTAVAPPMRVIPTSTGPAAGARFGVTAVMVRASTTTTCVASVPPKVTTEPAVKLVPESVTVVPPPAGPEAGVMDVRASAAGGDGVAVPAGPESEPAWRSAQPGCTVTHASSVARQATSEGRMRSTEPRSNHKRRAGPNPALDTVPQRLGGDCSHHAVPSP